MHKSSFLDSFYCATAIIIILGALQGRLTPNLTLIVSILGVNIIYQTIAYTINETILFNWSNLALYRDLGKGMNVHLFGGIAGFVCGFIIDILSNKKSNYFQSSDNNNKLNLISTLFLIVYFPSFIYYIFTPSTGQERVVY